MGERSTKIKNGTLRVCLDPCDLKQAIEHQHLCVPTSEDVCSKLAGKLQPKHSQVPELPWMKVGADIFDLNGPSYLLLVDYLYIYIYGV